MKRQPLVVTSDDQLEQAASGIYGKQAELFGMLWRLL